MRLLITGGCGFLGSNLAAAALARGFELSILDNLSRVGSQENKNWLSSQGAFQFIHADIRNQNDVARTVKEIKPDVIFHLAGQVAMTTSILDPRKDFEINVIGTFNLLEAVKEFSPECIVLYSSTNKVYGDLEQFNYIENSSRYICQQHPTGFDENISLDFHSPYGCSKGAADQYMLDYARIFGLKTIVFRHSSMYGGRQFSSYDQGWIGWFCQQALVQSLKTNSKPFTISGNGKQVRDVLHSDDVVTLYFSALDNIDKVKGHAFNIGGGINASLSLLELFNKLESYIDVSLNYEIKPQRESDQKVFVANIEKAKALFGWEPKVNSDAGLKRMLDWVKQSG